MAAKRSKAKTRHSVAVAVTSPQGVQTVDSWDVAWHLALTLPKPVNIREVLA